METGNPSERLDSTKTSAGGEQVGDVASVAEEVDPLRQPSFQDRGRNLLQQRAVSDEGRPIVRPGRCERLDEGGEILGEREPADADDAWGAVELGRRRKGA